MGVLVVGVGELSGGVDHLVVVMVVVRKVVGCSRWA